MEDVTEPCATSSSSVASPAAPDPLTTAKLSVLLHSLRSLKSSPSTRHDKVIVMSMLDVVSRMLEREADRQSARDQIDDGDELSQQPRLNWNFTWLDGSQSSKQQHAALVAFQSADSPGRAGQGVSIFLLSLAAGGPGLNLSAANHLFMLDLWSDEVPHRQMRALHLLLFFVSVCLCFHTRVACVCCVR